MNKFQTITKLKTWKPSVFEIYADEVLELAPQAPEGLYFINQRDNHLYVYRGNLDLDLDYCELNRMHIYNFDYVGGPIIGSEIDLSFGFKLPKGIESANSYILQTLVQILRAQGLNAHYFGNDLLIDNMKVGGTFERRYDDHVIWCAQISFRDYSKHIEHLCTKRTLKRPGYIKNYQFTKEQLKQEIIKAFT